MSPSSFVGNNLDDETARAGSRGSRTSSSGRGTAILAGRSNATVWFYAAYNHFKIDKEISGVPRQFSDLGVFETTRARSAHASQKDTLVGYYQWGGKFKPRRGLSSTIGPESILAQDSRSSDVQRPVAARVVEPPVQRLKVGLSGLAGRWRRRLIGVRLRLASTPAPPPRRVRAGWRGMRAARSPSTAPNRRSRGRPPITSQKRRQPRLQVRRRVGQRPVEVREQRQLRADPVSRAERRHQRDPGHRPGDV